MSTTKRRSSRVQKIASEAAKKARLEHQKREDLPDFSDCKPDDVLTNFAAIPQQFLWTFNLEEYYDEKLFYGVKLS